MLKLSHVFHQGKEGQFRANAEKIGWKSLNGESWFEQLACDIQRAEWLEGRLRILHAASDGSSQVLELRGFAAEDFEPLWRHMKEHCGVYVKKHLPRAPLVEADFDNAMLAVEACADKVDEAPKDSVQKKAREADLMKKVEIVRDSLKQAMGDKQALNRVFTANGCERIGRLQLVLRTVRLEVYQQDQRWIDLEELVSAIEALLRELGTLSTWRPPLGPKYISLARRQAIADASRRRQEAAAAEEQRALEAEEQPSAGGLDEGADTTDAARPTQLAEAEPKLEEPPAEALPSGAPPSEGVPQPEPAQPEPAQPEPAQPEPVQPEMPLQPETPPQPEAASQPEAAPQPETPAQPETPPQPVVKEARSGGFCVSHLGAEDEEDEEGEEEPPADLAAPTQPPAAETPQPPATEDAGSMPEGAEEAAPLPAGPATPATQVPAAEEPEPHINEDRSSMPGADTTDASRPNQVAEARPNIVDPLGGSLPMGEDLEDLGLFTPRAAPAAETPEPCDNNSPGSVPGADTTDAARQNEAQPKIVDPLGAKLPSGTLPAGGYPQVGPQQATEELNGAEKAPAPPAETWPRGTEKPEPPIKGRRSTAAFTDSEDDEAWEPVLVDRRGAKEASGPERSTTPNPPAGEKSQTPINTGRGSMPARLAFTDNDNEYEDQEVTNPNLFRADPVDRRLGPNDKRKNYIRADSVLEGWVWKRSRYLKRWRRRWLVLWPSMLGSYKHRSDSQPSESVSAGMMLSVHSADNEVGQRRCFCVVVRGRDFFLVTDNEDQKQEWMREIEKCLGNKRSTSRWR